MTTIPTTEKKAVFARRIGASRQYVQTLVAKGLPLTAGGDVLVTDALEWLTSNVQTDNDVGTTSGLVEARTRLVLANARRAELALEREQRSYVTREEVAAAARAFGRAHRDAMLNFANRYGAGIAADAGCDAATLIGLIDTRMRDALREAVGIPVPFQKPGDLPPYEGDE